jgi:general secretion pathway protein M
VYPATGDTASVSTTLQSDIRQIFSDAGLTVSNSQVLPLREQEHFDHININFSVQGDISGVDAALTDIAKFRPLLLVESLEMRPLRSGRSGAKEQIVVVSLQLLALRAIL